MDIIRKHCTDRRAHRPLLLIAALFGLLVLVPGRAFADPLCATFDQFSNVDASVCYTVITNGTDYFMEVTSVSVNGSSDITGIFSIGWDTDANLNSGPDAGWAEDNEPPDLHNIDGFSGSLWESQATNGGSNASVGAVWTFDGDPGTDIVFHIAYEGTIDSCSTWVSVREKPNAGLSDKPGCGTTTVPEPATLTLLGTGLVAVGGMARRKLRKK